MEDLDAATSLVRIYCSTVQRLPCDLKSLSSKAAFLIVCPAQRRCIVWIGSQCNPVDRTMAEGLAFDVSREDLMNPVPSQSIDIMQEDRENATILQSILEVMWVRVDDYRRALFTRTNTAISNQPMALYQLNRKGGSTGGYTMSCLMDNGVASNGSVARLRFPAESVDKGSILVVVVGEHYDLWAGDAVGRREQAAIKTFLTGVALEKVPEKRRGLEAVIFARNLCVVQDSDKTIFRAMFTTDTAPFITFIPTRSHKGRAGIVKSALSSTSSNNDQCSDCVGDTILRLLGMSSGDGSRLFWGPKPEQSSEQDSVETAEGAAIQSKIDRLADRTDLRFLNAPRAHSKLLVLDLDHTLIDFSSRFDFMIDQLKRPHLDRFLAACYRANFDIAIWSQTNWRWLELKLTEMGMLARKDYKICFALDKSSMFTVRQNYIKPLQIIWQKHPERWGPWNTIHVDDLARNFELNRQSGLMIAPFYLRPDAAQQDAMRQSAAYFAKEDEESSTPSDSAPICDAANDRELYLLALYLTHVAPQSDFTKLDHAHWRREGIKLAAHISRTTAAAGRKMQA